MNKRGTEIMASTDETLIVIVNRVLIGCYAICKRNKVSAKKFNEILDDLSEYVFNEKFLNSISSEVNLGADLKVHIESLSLSIRNLLMLIEDKRQNVNKIKNADTLKTTLDKFTSYLLVFNDLFLDLQQCNDESEINEKLQEFLGNAE